MAINSQLISKVTEIGIKNSIPTFRTGDTIKAHVKIKEGNKERIQNFEGVVIKTQGEGISKSVTIRKMSFGVGVELSIPLNSPDLVDIEIIKLGKVRQSRIYYLRELKGKKARIKPRQEKVKQLQNPQDTNKSSEKKELTKKVPSNSKEKSNIQKSTQPKSTNSTIKKVTNKTSTPKSTK